MDQNQLENAATQIEVAARTDSHEAFKELQQLSPQDQKAILGIMRDDVHNGQAGGAHMSFDGTNQQLVFSDPYLNARVTYGRH